MALNIIKKTAAPRANLGVSRDFDYNDLIFRVGEAKGQPKDEFIIAPNLLESTGLKDADKGGALIFDDEALKFYLAVVPKAVAEIFKPRENKSKTRNFQHKDALEIMVAQGLIPADREIGYITAFSMTSRPELVEALEGATAVYELATAEVVKRLLGGDSKDESTAAETTAPSTDTVSDAAPAVVEAASVAAPEADWDE